MTCGKKRTQTTNRGVPFSDKAEVQECLWPGSQQALGGVLTLPTADNPTAGSERQKQTQHGINRGKRWPAI